MHLIFLADQSSAKLPTELNTTKSTRFSVSSLQNPYNLTVGSMVQYGRPPKYGVIEWIGSFPEDKKTVYAGLIMVRNFINICTLNLNIKVVKYAKPVFI